MPTKYIFRPTDEKYIKVLICLHVCYPWQTSNPSKGLNPLSFHLWLYTQWCWPDSKDLNNVCERERENMNEAQIETKFPY